MAYPGQIDTQTTYQTGMVVEAAHVNDLSTEIVSIETTLGTNPQGSSTDVAERLDDLDTATGGLQSQVSSIDGRVSGVESGKVSKSGDTMSGSLAIGTSTAAGSSSLSVGASSSPGGLAFSQGGACNASGLCSMARGGGCSAVGGNSFASGGGCTAYGDSSHALGGGTICYGDYALAAGGSVICAGQGALATGSGSLAAGIGSFSCGAGRAHGDYSTAEGTSLSGVPAHVCSISNTEISISGDHLADFSFGEYIVFYGLTGGSANLLFSKRRQIVDVPSFDGSVTKFNINDDGLSNPLSDRTAGSVVNNSRGLRAHSEGEATTASGSASHAQNRDCHALGDFSHAGGSSATALGSTSFAHGAGCQAAAELGFVTGRQTNSNHDGATILGDNQAITTESDEVNQLKVRYENGFRLIRGYIDHIGDAVKDGFSSITRQKTKISGSASPVVMETLPMAFPSQISCVIQVTVKWTAVKTAGASADPVGSVAFGEYKGIAKVVGGNLNVLTDPAWANTMLDNTDYPASTRVGGYVQLSEGPSEALQIVCIGVNNDTIQFDAEICYKVTEFATPPS